jgi:Tfp pilus assembly protein PilF
VDDRRPTAQQIAELIELVRRDPSSPIALQLAEAYLALGRPHDAIGTLEIHLQAAPSDLEGRVSIARAYADLHQWREAQGELLRVVKVDRTSRRAFTLLGEVLLRRDDFERAIPVLQHAQILDPTSPTVLAMLRRARGGQRLDPPPPIPQPLPPRGESGRMANQGAAMASMSPAAPRVKAPTQPPPPQLPPKERPRVISQAKVVNAAASALRQSASVGEAYLSELVHGGLLDIAGVRVPTTEFDLRPDRRWGRSTRRAFIFLFVVVVLGATGGGTWKWWSGKQRDEVIVRLRNEAKGSITLARLDALTKGVASLSEARDKDPSDLVTQAYLAEVAALDALLYGPHAEDAANAIAAVGQDLPGGDGAAELTLAKAALALTRLRDVGAGKDAQKDAKSSVAEAARSLDDLIAKQDTNPWARWLRARVHIAAGERKLARTQLKQVGEGSDGLVIAVLDLAELDADDGNLDSALKLYDGVLARVKEHPLAILGKALARAEANVAADHVIAEVNAKLTRQTHELELAELGERLIAYRELAFALAYYDTDITDNAVKREKAAMASPVGEPRFWTLIAWLDTQRGAHAAADAARAKVVYYGNVEPDLITRAIDVEREMASAHPDHALDLASKLGNGTIAYSLRTSAMLELGRAKDAVTASGELVALSTPKGEASAESTDPSLDARTLAAEARVMAAGGGRDSPEEKAMQDVALRRTNKIARHAAAMAELSHGELEDARRDFKSAVEDLDAPQAPNPVAERSLAWYADTLIEVARAEAIKDVNDAEQAVATAKDSLDRAAKINPAYLPIQAMRAKLELYKGDAEAANAIYDKVKLELGVQYPRAELVWAEILVTRRAADSAKAQEILERVKDKVPPAMVGRVAALIDPKLPEQLGVPGPEVKLKPGQPPPRRR